MYALVALKGVVIPSHDRLIKITSLPCLPYIVKFFFFILRTPPPPPPPPPLPALEHCFFLILPLPRLWYGSLSGSISLNHLSIFRELSHEMLSNMDKWFKDILPEKDPYHNRGRDQMRKKGSGIRVPVCLTSPSYFGNYSTLLPSVVFIFNVTI